MAFRFWDRVRDTTTGTGTGTVTVSGTAPLGYITFTAVPNRASSDTLMYVIAHQSANEWEVGLGTYAGTHQISRTSVFSSSTGTAAVNFSPGTKDVANVYPAASHAGLNVESQTLSGGANVTSKSLSTGNITVDCGARPLQYIINAGAFTATAPTSDGSCILLVTNTSGAGTVSFTGFTVGASVGDALTTTNAHKFSIHIWRVNGVSGYRIAAHQ
jgi:hypothetical protein